MSGTIIQAHAALQLIAFLVFFPIGSMFALYRERIGSSWFMYHVLFQSLGTMSVIIAVALAVAHSRGESSTKRVTESRWKRLHRANGYLLVSVLAFQWLWAVVVRRYIEWNIWLNVHMVLATLLFILAFIQITLGMILFSSK